MESHGAKRPADPIMYDQRARKIYRPNGMEATQAVQLQLEELSPPTPSPSPPNMDRVTLGHCPASTTIFLSEVLNSLYGERTGHPEPNSLGYHKAAEHYALSGAYAQWYLKPPTKTQMATISQQKSQLPQEIECAWCERQQAAHNHHNNYYQNMNQFPQQQQQFQYQHTNGDTGRSSFPNELSHLYLQLLQHQLPQQQAQQQHTMFAGGANNMSMPIYNMTNNNTNDINLVYTQLLAANLSQNSTQQHRHRRMQQQQQQHQLQQRYLQQQQQHEQQQQQYQAHQQQQQQQQHLSRNPRGIYGNNYSSGSLNKTTSPDKK